MAPSNLTNDARKKLAANLQVLRRYDEQIEAIIDTTSHVVLYQFQEDSQSWANKEVEGALFIYKRSSVPHYGFTIMNRVGLENYTEYLSTDLDFQTSGQIVIYKSKNSDSFVGIWIYEETDRNRIPEQLSICCKSTKTALSGQSPQRLYPKNAEEEKEFLRMYPRSRSNSRKEGIPENQNMNALAAVVNRTRQQQQQKQQKLQTQTANSNSPVAANTGNAVDLVKKLRAIGLDPTGRPDKQSESISAGDLAVLSDPSIIMARKSVKPQETSTVSGNVHIDSGTQRPYSQDQSGQPQDIEASHVSQAMAQQQSVPPLVHLQSVGVGAANGYSDQVAIQAMVASIPPPSSPILYPAPSPFPPSTIATPLPAQGPPRNGFNSMYPQQGVPFWMPHMGSPPVARSAHASPAPPIYGVVPGLYAFPQLLHSHNGASHTPQPPVQVEAALPTGISAPLPGSAVRQDSEQSASASSPAGSGASVAQNLAEQLVSLVRQRMNTVQQMGGAVKHAEPEPSLESTQPALPPNATKMQRDYCREWLIRVIQMDDELVDAFVKRFPPPIFPPQQQQQQQSNNVQN